MTQVLACPHCGKPIEVRASLRQPNPEFGPNVKTNAMHTLARHGLTLADAQGMTDDDLSALPHLGRQSLRWIRSQEDDRP